MLIDAGGPVEPLLEAIDAGGYTLSHVLLTHHHYDHVRDLDKVLARFPGTPVLIHPGEREHVPQATGDLNPGDTVTAGALRIEALHTPGHTNGMLALVVDGTDVFTGDTLFKGSVGGVRAPGSTSYADLKSSVMDTLMALPPETVVHPGHTDPTTIARGVRDQRLREGLARARPRGSRAVPGDGGAGDARPARRRLRRRPQGLGPLAGWA